MRAAHLFGASAAIREQHAISWSPDENYEYAPYLAKVRAILGEEGFVAAWNTGHTMTYDQALDLARCGQQKAPTIELGAFVT